MTSEEIIQRLLDEKKITAKEALIILKDLAKIGLQEVGMRLFPDTITPKKDGWGDNVVVMYGVTTNPYTFSKNDLGESSAISSKPDSPF